MFGAGAEGNGQTSSLVAKHGISHRVAAVWKVQPVYVRRHRVGHGRQISGICHLQALKPGSFALYKSHLSASAFTASPSVAEKRRSQKTVRHPAATGIPRTAGQNTFCQILQLFVKHFFKQNKSYKILQNLTKNMRNGIRA